MARTVVHVRPTTAGSWKVEREGATRASAILKTQAAAIERGAQLAQRVRGDAQLVIHGEDGRVRDERTYGRDPFPPRG